MSADKGKGPIIDPGLCRCCGSLKRCRLLNVEYQCMGQKEVYSDMIMDCFGLLMSHLDDKPSARLVCATCVARLREAAAFRAQVLRCEAAFLQLRMCETEAADKQARLDASAMLEVEIKPEPPDEPPEPPGSPPGDPDDLDDRDDLDLKEHMDETEEPERVQCQSPADSDDMPLKRRKKRAGNGRLPPVEQPPGLEDQDRRPSAEDETELKKHRANIKILLECSNATPIRCFSGFGYKCCYCTEIYTNPNDLKTHTLTKHDVRTRKVLMRRNLLFAFLVKLDITGLKCMLCLEAMDGLDNLIEHLKIHQKKLYTDVKSHILPFKFDDGLKCVVCAKVFTKFRSIQEHMNVHFRNYICDICGTGYPNKKMLVQHCNIHKTGVFNCEYCPKSFNTEQKKKIHERFVHIYANSNFLNKCGVCKERFKCYRAKEKHMLAMHGVSSAVKCQACEKTYKNQRLLTIHVQRDHLMQRPHKCTICDMSFFEKQELKNHFVKHSGSREYRCELCLKEFGRRKTLREHMRIHEERRFRCEECGVGFVQRCGWRGHMRAKHSVVC